MYLVVMFNCSIQINEYSIFKMGWRRAGLGEEVTYHCAGPFKTDLASKFSKRGANFQRGGGKFHSFQGYSKL